MVPSWSMAMLTNSLYDKLRGGEDLAILQLYSEPLAEELNLLLVSIHMMCPILCEVVELLAVLID
jgi:hypothetical protein